MLRRSLALVVAALVFGALPAATAAATTPPATLPAPTVAPPDTSPPATQPNTPATTVPADNGGDSGTDWLPIVLIVVLVVALVVVLSAIVGRNKRPAPAPAVAQPRTPPVPSPQENLLTTGQWIHDQLSLELMAGTPAAAAQRWSVERSRLDNVAIGAQQQFAAGNDPSWEPFAQTMSSLAVALDTNLQLRAQDPPNAQLIEESIGVVNRNRATLQQLIYILRPTSH